MGCPPSSGWDLMMMQYSEASEREPRRAAAAPPFYVISADLGQMQDYTALSIIQRTEGTNPRTGQPEGQYQLRYLHRHPLPDHCG